VLLSGDVRAATEAVKGLGREALIGFGVVGAAVGAATLAMRQSAASIAEIGDAARRAGMDVVTFQELSYVAEKNRISVDALTDGMKELSLRADEFVVTGKGPAAEAFQRLGLGADALAEKLSDPKALFIDIIDRLRQLDKAARIRIADEIFGGTAGERFVELIDQGADGIRDTIKEANRLGIVIDREGVDKAADVDAAFKRITNTIGTNLKAAVVDVAGELTHWLDLLDAVDRRSDATIRKQIQDKMVAVDRIAYNFGPTSTAVKNGLAEIDLLQKELAKRALERGPTRVQTFGRKDGMVDFGSGSLSFTPIKVDPDADKARAKATKDAERQEAQYKRVIDALNREQAALSMTSLEQRIANEQVRAGVTAKSDQGKAISAVVTRIEQERKAQEAFNERLQFFGELGAGAFSDLIAGAENFEGVMRRVGLSIADAALQAAIFGQGPLASLFGLQSTGTSSFGGLLGLFDGFFAGGGSLGAGRWGIAGEAGYPEVVTGPAKVWTPADLAAVAGHSGASGGQSRLVVSLGPGLEASILDQAAGQSIAIVEDYDERRAPATARAAVAGANRSSTRREFRQ